MAMLFRTDLGCVDHDAGGVCGHASGGEVDAPYQSQHTSRWRRNHQCHGRNLNNISAVQSLGGMQREKEKYAERSAHAFWRGRINLLTYALMEMLIDSANAIVGLVIAIYVSNEVINNTLTVGDFFALFGLYMVLPELHRQ